MPIEALFREAAYGAETTRAMAKAFAPACKGLQDTGQPELIQEIIANRIIIAARGGLCDPKELCKQALASLGVESDCD